jgi:hypothetical protein
VFVLLTQDCVLGSGPRLGFGNSGVGGAGGEFIGLFAAGSVLEIPAEWYDETTMTRTGPVPGKYSLLGLTNPYSAALIPWSTISPGAAPLNQE